MTQPASAAPSLAARPERRLIRRTGSYRHVDFVVTAPVAAAGTGETRTPLRLALVLDRSGSMAGEKLATAKQAALAVVDRLDDRDRCAVVVFDDRVDVVHETAPATAEAKGRLRAELARVEARASTALHEGWLTGARAVAGDEPSDRALSRVFLLTDGLANVGETDPERIASEAHGIRENAGIGTSTFGIGADYNEALLGPMAVAGGGQFHHLRSTEEITRTFVGELGELFAVAARNVVLEIDADPAVTVDVVGAYRASPRSGGVAVGLGDLVAGEERHVVVRFGFPPQTAEPRLAVRARLTAGAAGPDQTVSFAYAEHDACDAEPRDPAVMRHVGLQHADRARREAAQLSRGGDTQGARTTVERVARRIAEYAGADQELRTALDDLRFFQEEAAAAPLPAMAAKEAFAGSLRRSRGQRDLRGP